LLHTAALWVKKARSEGLPR